MKFKILIVDDDELICSSLKKVLNGFGYLADALQNAENVIEVIDISQPDLVLLDIHLDKFNGVEVLKEIQKKFRNLTVIMITGYSDVKLAVNAMKSGAYDFLLKPLDVDQLKIVLDKVFEKIALKYEVQKLSTLLKNDSLTREFFGKSRKIQNILSVAEKYAASPDTTILIEGESGTGKEGLAKYIHQFSSRSSKSFIQINCSAIPRELAESELFGHEKGAFTGAAQTKLGKFELANGGTLLLDEIAELSQELQAKLLRVLQDKKFYRVGGEKEVNVDVRVLAATNKNLEEEVSKGNFREDLFYRLNVVKIHMPPLRERKDDIPVLAYCFLKEFSVKLNKEITGIEPKALEELADYSWKGNIRELRNIMERAALLTEGDEIKEHHLNFIFNNSKNNNKETEEFSLKIPNKGIKIDIVLKDLIQKTLKITSGNQVKAAKVLGLSRSKLRYRMEQLGIEVTKNIK
ncbi:MAG TPA: sigma-54 dependent transcriptional regulator [Ignavibacteriaceae bacterium]|nr:sigma-54 dependent transcriptional regulator [Ignavibacteriaceae bacterium]